MATRPPPPSKSWPGTERAPTRKPSRSRCRAAAQVADRWHLLSNLRDNVERMLHRLGPQMRQAAQQVTVGDVTLGSQGLPSGTRLRGWQRLSDERRATRLALYEKVMVLHAQGGTMKGIGRELSIDHRTVRSFITSGVFPERARRARGPTPLDSHRRYIEERIAEGLSSSDTALA